jgi:pimeloyl-ACP methyl ester carboxylesterase
LISAEEGRARMHQLSQYIGERARFRERWLDSLPKLEAPMNLIWAKEDPIAVPAIPEALARLCPRAKLEWLEGLGHYPMLEDPARWAAALSAVLG